MLAHTQLEEGLGLMNLVMVKLITVEILAITEICHPSNRPFRRQVAGESV